MGLEVICRLYSFHHLNNTLLLSGCLKGNCWRCNGVPDLPYLIWHHPALVDLPNIRKGRKHNHLIRGRGGYEGRGGLPNAFQGLLSRSTNSSLHIPCQCPPHQHGFTRLLFTFAFSENSCWPNKWPRTDWHEHTQTEIQHGVERGAQKEMRYGLR